MNLTNKEFPKAVSPDEWNIEHEKLLVKEKELTRLRDRVNAERRRMPAVEIKKEYLFEGPDGEITLWDLFGDHRQLLLYHFMFGPDDDKGCVGCSMLVDNMGHPAHLEARGTKRILVSRAPLEKLEAFKQRMGWTIPWYSSFGSDFNYDFGVSTDKGETFGLSVFLRDKD